MAAAVVGIVGNKKLLAAKFLLTYHWLDSSRDRSGGLFARLPAAAVVGGSRSLSAESLLDKENEVT